jgi:hypothetical protein
MRPEDALQCRLIQILREFARPDVVYFHVPNGDLRDRATAAKLFHMGVRPGVSDLVFIVDGRCHFLELKEGKGRMSNEQTVFMEDAERAGASYHCATGFNEAIAAINEIGACRARLTVPQISDARSDVGMRVGEGAAMPSPNTFTERDRARA